MLVRMRMCAYVACATTLYPCIYAYMHTCACDRGTTLACDACAHAHTCMYAWAPLARFAAPPPPAALRRGWRARGSVRMDERSLKGWYSLQGNGLISCTWAAILVPSDFVSWK